MRIILKYRDFTDSKRGSTHIVIVSTIVIVVLVSALLSDIGYEAIMRLKLNIDTETIAKAGAEEFAKNKNINLERVIYRYTVNRINDFDNLNIKVSESGKEITVRVIRPFNYIFLKLIGISGKRLDATATAEVQLSN
jgi:hypothetical protein